MKGRLYTKNGKGLGNNHDLLEGSVWEFLCRDWGNSYRKSSVSPVSDAAEIQAWWYHLNTNHTRYFFWEPVQ